MEECYGERCRLLIYQEPPDISGDLPPSATETEQVGIAICPADEIVQENLGGRRYHGADRKQSGEPETGFPSPLEIVFRADAIISKILHEHDDGVADEATSCCH